MVEVNDGYGDTELMTAVKPGYMTGRKCQFLKSIFFFINVNT